MSDHNAEQTVESLKSAVLATLPPEASGLAEGAEPGKYAAGFDFSKFQALLKQVDHAVAPLAPIVASLTPPQFSAVVLAVAAALHAAAGGDLHLPQANAPAGEVHIG